MLVLSVFSARLFYSLSKILSRRSWLLLSGLIFLCCSQFASAQTFNVPATSTTGSFTISWSGVPATAKVDELQNGTWVTITSGYSSGSVAVTKTTSGTYSYRLQSCNYSSVPPYTYCTYPQKNIVVTISAPGCVHGTGNTTTYCYDELGRVTSVRHPNGVINSYTYDAADNRTKKISN